uniref:Tectonic family member 2 n=2 Tax=Ficedula albicollis TaxID=59894 RepID=U3K3W3_FICAL
MAACGGLRCGDGGRAAALSVRRFPALPLPWRRAGAARWRPGGRRSAPGARRSAMGVTGFGALLMLLLLLLLRAAPCPGDSVFQPSFIHMSGSRVNSFFLGNSSGVNFSIILNPRDAETGKLQLANCSGNRRAGDWKLDVTPGVNTSKVTVSLSRTLELCLPNATECCPSPLCMLETLQVVACRGSVMLAQLLIQAEIFANSSFAGNVSENATIIPNQAFKPLGSCPCDLTAGACDVRCCCDLECTPDLLQLFSESCFTGVFGGDVNPPFDQLCSSQSMEYTPEWFPFLCVQSSLDNTPFLGYFYHGSTSTPKVPSFKIPLQTSPGKPFTGYREGDPIITEEDEYFTVPQQSMAGQCVGNAPVAYLHNFDVKCLTSLESYKEGLPHDVRINSGTADFIQQNVVYRAITDRSKFITESENLLAAEVLCQNVTFAEHYKFTWKDGNIEQINVTVFLGSLCDGEILTQRFTVEFLSLNSTDGEDLFENPGYQVGKPVKAANLNASDPLGSLNIWQPAGRGLCASATYRPVLFGVDSYSGCILEVDINEDCSLLRGNVTEKLNALIRATHIGKRDNSSYSDVNDWVEIIRLDPFSSNVSTGGLRGICPDIPANLNIRIIFAKVGAVQGIPQQQILAVQISYSTVLWQFQCGIGCKNTLSILPITASVQFIEVPAQPPPPVTRYRRIYAEFDCNKNEVCWPQLLYPLTRFYTGEPYSQCLAKGLFLAFLVLLAAITSNPWFSKLWNR